MDRVDADRLFDAPLLERARAQGHDAPFHWLALSDDPEAENLRDALEACWPLAEASQTQLRNGLLTERWGQHVGAMAQLFALGMFGHDGFGVRCDPTLTDAEGHERCPDILAERDGHAFVAEVRAITGMGRTPWKARELQRRAGAPPPDLGKLAEVVRDVVVKKADAYRDLVDALDVPYVIVIYADTDAGLPGLLRDVLFGPATERRRRDDRWGQAPGGGLFGARRKRLAHVSAVAVFGRVDDDVGSVAFHGEWLVNPHAQREISTHQRPPSWRALCLDSRHAPPRMTWEHGAHAPSTCRFGETG